MKTVAACRTCRIYCKEWETSTTFLVVFWREMGRLTPFLLVFEHQVPQGFRPRPGERSIHTIPDTRRLRCRNRRLDPMAPNSIALII